MRKYNIVGAFDRHNYGDILFPLIHSEFIRRHSESAEINYYSLSESNLESIGGVRTKSIKSLLNKSVLSSPEDRVIMCGGDILTVDWVGMLGHLSGENFYFLLKVARKLLGVSLSNQIIRIIWGQKNKYPYIITHKNIECKIFYTGVGGSGFELSKSKFIHDIPRELIYVDSISVRESITKEYLVRGGVSCNLLPDTALIMSDYYPISKLAEVKWKNNVVSSNNFSFENYIVFQCARANGEGYEDQIVNEIIEINKKLNISIILLPIGRATGHEDHVILSRIFTLLSNASIPVAMQNDPHVLSIMATLANAKAYIGTSLHGAITSYSFGHKVCAISTRKVVKLRGFLEAWMDPADYSVSSDFDFSDDFLRLCSESYDINNDELLVSQKNMISAELSQYL
ncbi:MULTISPECIES: polysaccharide pyruvyl transferase family protein [Klebsiella]|uniref:polysaccharide pyruvyl transferase family protein n=1 Tax=Klebsiella TaxID=570 RepID=UPI00080910EE|nr:polysaccharide pyruvyl transferase family protein [Klebsiella quasipneumoniae]EIW8468637.1 polysaccharide pyruvyl transferase family protein [Klebsiella pneumoniae]EIW8500401.1 polysaccharide pyruvyl transferase family protein [Klebsiella pneumoniae]MBC4928328.1 polysaccharide pyruvyl transferase family protein [Klebsiella quasipneumoniae]MBY5245167.1 polysaccharide pyruvyl transferase family protein [Klebsiella quasipneumoniae]QER53679.1 polysaccharide pyruvyl transferase family protein [K